MPEPISAAQRDAFALYVEPEIPAMLRVARSLTHHDADAEDLVQDTLVRAARAIDSFDGKHPRAWLFTIMRRVHINRLRKRHDQLLSGDDTSQFFDNASTPQPSAEQVALTLEVDGDVQQALERLPEIHREVLLLVDVQGYRYQEAADQLGVARGTVMSRLHRARGALRSMLTTEEGGRHER